MKFSRSTAMSAALALIATGAVGTVGVVTAPAAMAATYEVVATIPASQVGTVPRGIAVSATHNALYVAASGDNRLNVIDLSTNARSASVTVGTGPFWVDLGSGDDTAYVTNNGSNSVSVVRLSDDSLVGNVSVGSFPVGIAVASDDSVYVAHDISPAPNYVQRINGKTLVRDDTVQVDTGSLGIGVIDNTAPTDDTVVVANQDSGTFQTIGSSPLAVAQTTNTGAGSNPWGVSVLPNGTKYYVSLYGDDSVVRVDAATNTIDDTIAVGDGPTGMALSADGSRLFVANTSSNTLSVIDTSSRAVIQSVPVGNSPLGVAVHPTTGLVYVSNEGSNTISIIQLVSPPPPPPAEPPGPPVNVGGVPGDRQVAVTWDPPSSSGSFPVSTYQVETRPYDEEPISNSCLATAPALTCTVTGLTNGKPYVFRVRALSGAGWGPWSKESPQVTPRKETEPTYAVIKELPTGRNAWGVAVNNTTDAVYVTNREGRSVSTYDGQSGTPASTIAVGDTPVGVAVNQTTGSVYVANFGLSPSPYTRTVVKIDGATGTISGSIPLNGRPYSVAINDRTNTIYATSNQSASGASLFIMDGDTDSVIKRLTVPSGEGGVAVDQTDDTVYVANAMFGAKSVSVIDGRTNEFSGNPINVGVEPTGVAIDQTDDTVFVTNRGFSNDGTTMSVINARTRDVGTVTVGKAPLFLAVDSANHLAYVPNIFSSTVSMADTRTQIVKQTLAIPAPRSVAVDEAGPNAGVAYVTRGGNKLAVIANAEPSLVTRTGKSGDTAVLDVDVPQAAYLVDDATVQGITFGGVAATILGRVAGKDQWRVQVPEGSGTVPVVVTFNGGLSAPAGPFTYVPDPTPKEPRDVTGEPGDGEVTVTWKEPESPGDSPITEYEVVSEPDGKTCTVTAPTLTCTIPGLRNGIPYTFKVRAKNGSGWGPYSDPTPVIIPVGPVPQPGTPGVPRDVTETPGPKEILVTWKEPENPGNTPILEYVATVHPSGKTCRVPAPQLSCRIPGLEDGVPYEVTVVAINGNGAGSPSPMGAPVTPAPDAKGIVITGDRDDARKPNGLVTVEGLTTGIAAGTQLTAYTRTSSTGTYKAGAKVTVNIGGNFTWKREVKRGKDLEVYFAVNSATSNTLTLPARTITITGSRDNGTVTKGKNRVTIKGTSINLPAGTKLVAKVTTKRGGPYTDGLTVTVAADGTFTWKRNVNKRKTLWVYFVGGKAISNTLKFLPKP